jgi:hypothetical protein
VVEAAYDLGSSDADWLRGILVAARPLLDRGLGVAGWCYEIESGISPSIVVRHPTYLGCSAALHGCFVDMAALVDARELVRLYGGRVCDSFSDRMRGVPGWSSAEFLRNPIVQQLTRASAPEFLQVNAREVTSANLLRGVELVAPRAKVGHFPARTSGLFARLSRHVVAGARVRRELRQRESGPIKGIAVDAEATLDEAGRVRHAEGTARTKTARSLLERAARDMLESQGKLRRADPERAVELWRGMVDGRWSLLSAWEDTGFGPQRGHG